MNCLPRQAILLSRTRELEEKVQLIARTSNGFGVKFIRNLASLALVIIGVLLWWFDIPELLRTFSDSNVQSLIWVLVISSVCYCLLMMLPFVPGVELGFFIMMMFGPESIIGVYVLTVVSLVCSFLIGRHLSALSSLEKLKCNWQKQRAANPAGQIHEFINKTLNLLGHRPYFSVAMLLNLPGNTILGGGGGIALAAGVSGELTLLRYLITVMLATSVIPLLILLGWISIGTL
jgi:hypothetical protein